MYEVEHEPERVAFRADLFTPTCRLAFFSGEQVIHQAKADINELIAELDRETKDLQDQVPSSSKRRK